MDFIVTYQTASKKMLSIGYRKTKQEHGGWSNIPHGVPIPMQTAILMKHIEEWFNSVGRAGSHAHQRPAKHLPHPQPRRRQPVAGVAQPQLAKASIALHPQRPVLRQRHRVVGPGGHQHHLAPSKLPPLELRRRQLVLSVVVAQAAVRSISPGEDVALRRHRHTVRTSAGRHGDVGLIETSKKQC